MLNNIALLLVAVLLLLSVDILAAESHWQRQESFAYLNEIRRAAGLQPFKSNSILQKAAQGHANYLLMNKSWGHGQTSGLPGFTGQTPLERILNAGYSSRHSSENVSTHKGQADARRSIDGLMGAIYHRFSFLAFGYDEIGIGHQVKDDLQSYVYNMANSYKARLCSSEQEQLKPGQYVFKVCADEQFKIINADFEESERVVQRKNPAFVVWPASQQINVPPAFYEEAPDPLPEVDVSGYPVSVQFNPVYFDEPPTVVSFNLVNVNSGQPIELVASFNQEKDINNKFTAYEHAIFPRHRLDWNTVYQADVVFETKQGERQSYSWQFKTTAFNEPFYQVTGGEKLWAGQKSLVVYAPPGSPRDGVSAYQVSFVGFTDVDVEIHDAHTLVISPKGYQGRAVFEFHDRKFTVYR